MWTGIIGALAGGAFGIGGTALLNEYNKANSRESSQRAYEYWRKSLLSGPTYQRRGLEKAGYNPMLALGSLPSQPSAGASVPSSSLPDITGSARQGAELARDLHKIFGLEVESKEADVKAKNALAQAAESDARTKMLSNKITRLLDGAKLDALEDGSAKGVSIGLTNMQSLLRDTLIDEWQLSAKEKRALNTKEGLQALLHEKLGKQAHSPLGKIIYDFLGDFMLPK